MVGASGTDERYQDMGSRCPTIDVRRVAAVSAFGGNREKNVEQGGTDEQILVRLYLP